MELHLNITGVFFLLLAGAHVIFPKRFNWSEELPALSLINRQMMQVHTFFIALMVLLMGVLCLSSAHEMVTTPLGRKIALGLGIFWGIRLLFQLFGYSSKLWKGKVFETAVHIVFSLTWAYISIVFLLVFWNGMH